MELGDAELENVRKDLLNMGVLVHRCISNSIGALLERDPKYAARVNEDWQKIEELEFKIEGGCEAVFQSQSKSLSKRDVNFAVTFLKIASELKEIGSVSLDISKISKALVEKKIPKIPLDIPHMRKTCEEMLVLNLEVIRSLDARQLISLSENEELIDGMCDQIRRVLISYIIEDPKNISSAERLKFIANNLERIGDHNYEIGRRLLALLPGFELNRSNCSPVESLQKG